MFDDELNTILFEHCNEMSQYACDNCHFDYVDEQNGCRWYHTAWAYLRLLDCVSSPQWHEDKYMEVLSDYVGNYDKVFNILISGTADFSLLHLIIEVLYDKSQKANIYILDKCRSPLHFCYEYINNYLQGEKKEYVNKNINVSCFKEDIFRVEELQFDIICSDAFLTRFKKPVAASVVGKWCRMLNPTGIIITTVRIHKKDECPELLTASKNTDDIQRKDKCPDLMAISKNIDKFEKKVANRYDSFIKQHSSFPIPKDKLLFLANRYIIKMESNDLGEDNDILELFQTQQLSVNSQKETLEGEINETRYLFIVARRKAW